MALGEGLLQWAPPPPSAPLHALHAPTHHIPFQNFNDAEAAARRSSAVAPGVCWPMAMAAGEPSGRKLLFLGEDHPATPPPGRPAASRGLVLPRGGALPPSSPEPCALVPAFRGPLRSLPPAAARARRGESLLRRGQFRLCGNKKRPGRRTAPALDRPLAGPAGGPTPPRPSPSPRSAFVLTPTPKQKQNRRRRGAAPAADRPAASVLRKLHGAAARDRRGGRRRRAPRARALELLAPERHGGGRR